jgi:hypothetical protein
MRADDLARLFVDHVYLPAISATVGNLEAPPGRTPATDLRKASEWFASLNQQDRDMVLWVVAAAAHSATFGSLALIDGVRPSGPDRYEVVAVDQAGARQVINPESSSYLHEAFQALVMLPDGRLRTSSATG